MNNIHKPFNDSHTEECNELSLCLLAVHMLIKQTGYHHKLSNYISITNKNNL